MLQTCSFESIIIKMPKNRMSVLRNCGQSQLKFWIRMLSHLIIKIMLTYQSKHKRKHFTGLIMMKSLSWNRTTWEGIQHIVLLTSSFFTWPKRTCLFFTWLKSSSSSKTWFGEPTLIDYGAESSRKKKTKKWYKTQLYLNTTGNQFIK